MTGGSSRTLPTEGLVYAGVGCSLTILSTTAMLALAVTCPAMRKHPYNLAANRMLCDLAFAVTLLVACVRAHHQHLDDDDCLPISLSLQFFSLAGQFWFFVVIFDLLVSFQYPFFGHESAVRMYHAIVWSASVVSALGMVASGDYGVSAVGMCWSNFAPRNVGNWLLLYIPIALAFVCSLSVWLYIRNKLHNTTTSSRLTSSTRRRVLEFSRAYIALFGAYWGVVVVLCFAVLVYGNGNAHLNGLVVGTLGLRGALDAMVWWVTEHSREVLSRSVRTRAFSADRRRALMQEHEMDLNFQKALRTDIMRATSQSIFLSANYQGAKPCTHILLDRDFTETRVESRVWRNHGGRAEGSQPVPYRFYDFAPQAFYSIRCRRGLGTHEYLRSFGQHDSGAWVAHDLIENSSGGRSGAFFYFSTDRRFVIKTMSRAENRALRRMLPEYHKYVVENPNTLISHFYGCHAIKIHFRKLYFAVIDNVFPSNPPHEVYDLKGSWVARQVMPTSLMHNPPRGTMKDLDFVGRGKRVHLARPLASRLLDQLKYDAAFLASVGIMDYSLLLGIHNCSQSMHQYGKGTSLFHPSNSDSDSESSRRYEQPVPNSSPLAVPKPARRSDVSSSGTP